MALAINQLNAISKKHIEPRITDNVFGAIPLFHRLRKRRQEQFLGGTHVEEPIVYQASGQAGGFEGDGPLPTISQENVTSAKYDLVSYQAPIIYSRRQEALNAGPNGVHKLLKVMQQVAELDIANQLGTDLFTGNQSAVQADKLDGLEFMVDDDGTPADYGEIATTDFAGWAADDTALSAAPTLFDYQKMIGRVTFGTDRPSLLVSTQSVFDHSWSLMQADQRFVDPKQDDAGFMYLSVSGIPLMVDPNCPGSGTSHTMYALNEKYLYLYVHKDVNMKMRDFMEPENSWNAVSHILWFGQLGTSRRKAHARLTGIDPS